MTKKSDKNKKKDVKDAELLPFNPLLGSMAISPEEESDQKVELIEKTQSLAELNKNMLEAKQRETELLVDNRKLDAALKLIEGINLVSDKALDPDLITKVLSKEKLSPMDFKLMADSMDKMASTLKSLMKPSIQDEYGNRKKTKIMAQFKSPDGTTASIGVAMGDDD